MAALRTALTVSVAAPVFAARLVRLNRQAAPDSTHTPEGLVAARRFGERVLRGLGVELDVRGAERVPLDGGFLFMWNQTSHLDHLVLGAAMPRPFLSLFNNAVARFPLYGEHMRRSGHFHVDRSDEGQWRPAIARAAAALQAGMNILVSPEGTRSWDERLLPMKRGAFLLAREARRPIVCVNVLGAHRCLGRGMAVVRPGRVRVVFSAPFYVEPLEEHVVQEFDRVREAWRLEVAGVGCVPPGP